MKNRPPFACLLALSLIASNFGLLRAAAAPHAQPPAQARPSPTPAAPPTAPATMATTTTTPATTTPAQATTLVPAQTTSAQSLDDEEVVRITVNLVQVDAVVTDREGRQVANLRPEDFEIFEDSRPQQITHFAYVSNDAPAAPPADANASTAAVVASASKPAPPAAFKPLRAAQVRRTMVLVVDDNNMSFESVPPLRSALRKFVEEQVRPGDLVALIRTGSDVGALQQFTNDKRQLLAAVERVRWNPCSRIGVHTTMPVKRDLMSISNKSMGLGDVSYADAEIPALCSMSAIPSTLSALRSVVEGMRELPGRKSLVLFTDSLPIMHEQSDSDAGQTLGVAPSDQKLSATDNNKSYSAPFQRIAELAVRASVVIYGVDTRGLPTLMVGAIDDVAGMTATQYSALVNTRLKADFDGGEGASILSSQTGGFVVKNNNDLNLGLRRIMEDQRGYYLIGFRPAEQTFDRRFHRLGVRLKNHPELTVRTRTGFYGMTEEESRPAARSREDRLRLALMSPFGAGDLGVRVTALFGNAPPAGSFVRTLLHVDARSLTFTDAADGWHKAVIDVGGIVFGDNGQVVVERRRTHTLSLRGQTYEHALNDGVEFALDLPLKKAGAYQVRVAVRDAATSRVGSAGQFVEVPALERHELALSSIVAGGSSGDADAASLSSNAPRAGAGDALASPGLRQLRQGMTLSYAYVVFNARLDDQTKQPRLLARTRLFRDGAEVFSSADAPIAVGANADRARLVAGGSLRLGTNLSPGGYVLQVVVTDPLADPKHRTATQWIDFEIVK
jgi:VWFA-related protein